MKTPAPPFPARCAMFLDVDGTLLELAPRPDQVHVPPPLVRLLSRLESALEGALALVSGRGLDELDGLFAPLKLPVAAVHGLVRRTAEGQLLVHEPPTGWRAALHPPLMSFAREHAGVLLEDKGHALALHYRRAPQLEDEARALAERLLEGASAPLRLLRGKMVLEFMPVGSDKGTAIREFVCERPFAGRTPVFIGDDVTDEAGFQAVNGLDGLSIRVGRSVDTAARHQLGDVPAVYEWLDRLARSQTERNSDA